MVSNAETTTDPADALSQSRCPRPWKIRYDSRELADIGAAESADKFDERFWPYRCRCGVWHLSTRRRGSKGTRSPEGRRRQKLRRRAALEMAQAAVDAEGAGRPTDDPRDFPMADE